MLPSNFEKPEPCRRNQSRALDGKAGEIKELAVGIQAIKTASSIVLLCGLLIFVSNSTAFAQVDEEKRTKICAKAEKRYQKLFGKPSASEDVTVVMMHKYTFCPPHVTVKQGTVVRFINVDKRTSHSVWFKQADKQESDRLFGEEKVEITFSLPVGDYPYLCGPHWKSEGMTGTVTVTP